MAIRDLIPWGRESNQVPNLYRDSDRDPFMALHREMNRLFDDAWRGFDTRLPSLSGGYGARAWPSMEISDGEMEIRVTAEIPGMDEKDVEVLLDDGVLTLRGEKRSETEDKDKQFSERFYGRFERRIPLGYEVEEDKVSAAFHNGVLTVTLPKTQRAQAKARRIAISGGSAGSGKSKH
ncbi:Hsp20/alpha crystallin family protein [Mesorhizobium sp. YC-39]|uniref:Hsp20/alpha crystallin family protein n=1 Tax=unclassified Mesorhizobium TaxID=325217 RepID=UPI0021E90A8F|nr:MULTISPECIES: Hsp20/alpha crystallin family protein [unclassified Mesorhizobium]MCV3209372.1 Hsp20/alpha crystallin family protein [Mesorhizobium sp. YC-2]MCV3231278.1 Hsp20/alpha crystallin family protein [Mesorhizobium sp. YC-39]